MKLFISSSGGFANISIQGEIDTDDLSPELAERVENFLSRDSISSEKNIENPYLADSQQISIRISSPEGSRQVDLDEETAQPELFQLGNELVHEIIRRKTDKI